MAIPIGWPPHELRLAPTTHGPTQPDAGTRRAPGRGLAAEVGEARRRWRTALPVLRTVALGYALAIGAELVVGGPVGATSLTPHPYWLVVLPVAAGMGLRAGVFAAVVGSILRLVGLAFGVGVPIAELGTPAHLGPCVGLLAGGALIGLIHDVRARQLRGHIVRTALREFERGRTGRKAKLLAEANRLLERHIAGRPRLAANLLAASARLQVCGRSDLFQAAVEIARAQCDGARVSAWSPAVDGSFLLLAAAGWADEESGALKATGARSAILRRARDSGTPISTLDGGEKRREEDPYFVAPVVGRQGLLHGLLCLDHFDPDRVDLDTEAVLLAVADLASAALVRIEEGEATHPPTAPRDAWPNLADPTALGERLALEFERSARYGSPLSVVAVQVNGWPDAGEEMQRALDDEVRRIVGPLRAADEIYRFGYPGCYAVVLAATAYERGDGLRQRLESRFTERTDGEGRIGLHTFVTSTGVHTPDVPSLIEQLARRFRARSDRPLGALPHIPHPPTQPVVGDVDAFLRRIRVEIGIARRTGMSILLVALQTREGPIEEAAGLTEAAHAAAGVLRPADAVYRVAQRLVLVLPATDADAIRAVVTRFVRAVEQACPDIGLAVVRVEDASTLVSPLVALDRLAAPAS